MCSPPADEQAFENEKPQHKVRITSFYLGKTEVTQEQYQKVMANNPSWFSSMGGGRSTIGRRATGQYSVEQVQWLDAIKFCNVLSEKDGLEPYYDVAGNAVGIRGANGPGYRLLTEAEWEYACRARTVTKYSFGDDPGDLRDYAWYGSNANNMTHAVGLKHPNNFGLYDMHGNVWEWCFDRYSDKSYSHLAAVHPVGTEELGDAPRAIRGGGWGGDPPYCRSARRYGSTPGDRGGDVGFRVAPNGPNDNHGGSPNSAMGAPPTTGTTASVEFKSASRAPTNPAVSRRPQTNWTSRSTNIELVRIEGGEFMMGSAPDDTDAQSDETPQHRVRISSFYLGKAEVTQEQYRAVMGDNPSYFSSTGGGRASIGRQSTAQHPVERVSWFDAIKFCNALSDKDGLEPYYDSAGNAASIRVVNGPGYRLPTEAEWEYACRARTTTKYSFGDESSDPGDHAWCESNSTGMTHAVGLKRPNTLGLYDMHGNAWEWCFDRYTGRYYSQSPAVDPQGPDELGIADRVIRGGC
jgi:formylglycine-generating enzyme required for sulfatase activity